MIGFEVVGEILEMVNAAISERAIGPYGLVPLNRDASAVDVGRRSVFKIFQAGVAGLLEIGQLCCVRPKMNQHTCA